MVLVAMAKKGTQSCPRYQTLPFLRWKSSSTVTSTSKADIQPSPKRDLGDFDAMANGRTPFWSAYEVVAMILASSNKRSGVDAGWRVPFAFQRSRPRATQAGC